MGAGRVQHDAGVVALIARAGEARRGMTDCVPQTTARNRLFQPDCGCMNESTTPLVGLEAEGTMRLASFENLLAVATLVTAIVVVLWGIRLFHGA